jgi:hypothetical protein
MGAFLLFPRKSDAQFYFNQKDRQRQQNEVGL